MPAPSTLHTPRFTLRTLLPADLPAFTAMNADPAVMQFFPRPWTADESRMVFDKTAAGFAQRGFGAYAVDLAGEFAGIIGLSVPSFESWFTPCVEILWRLPVRFQGRGIATEGAQAVLAMAFTALHLPEVVAFTAVINRPSIRVMEKLGMLRDPRGFEHPRVDDVRLQQHVLYRARPAAADFSA